MSEKSPLIYARMSAVMNEIGSIGRDNTNRQQGWKFRSIDDVYNALHKIMAKRQIFTTVKITNETQEKDGKATYVLNKYVYTFHTVDGSFIETESIGEAIDFSDKAHNKAASISHKYALLQTFCIPTEDMPDPDFETPKIEEKPKEEKPNPDAFIKGMLNIGVTMDELKQIFGDNVKEGVNKCTREELATYYREMAEVNKKKSMGQS